MAAGDQGAAGTLEEAGRVPDVGLETQQAGVNPPHDRTQREFGIAGAAAAWASRVIFDAFAVTLVTRRISDIQLRIFDRPRKLVYALLVLLPPLVFALYWNNYSLWLIPIVFVSFSAYLVIVLSTLLEESETNWLKDRLRKFY